jgi:hypothetical protein
VTESRVFNCHSWESFRVFYYLSPACVGLRRLGFVLESVLGFMLALGRDLLSRFLAGEAVSGG